MAITEAGRSGPVRDDALTALAADLHGTRIRPPDDGYDPANLFRLNPNIAPVAPEPRRSSD